MGIGKAGHVAARFLNENTSNASVYSTDGWFLKTLIETGIWGLLSYLIFACTFFILLIKNIVRDRKNRILVFLLTVFIAINLQNMVSNVLDFYLFSYLYWGLIGLTANIIYNKPRTNI
jgi:O-antigen ligase